MAICEPRERRRAKFVGGKFLDFREKTSPIVDF
jgi:hypothetical protein